MTTTNTAVCAQLRSKLQNLQVRLKIAQPLDIKPLGSHDMPSAGSDPARQMGIDEFKAQIDAVMKELDANGCEYDKELKA
jgi:hypothetical protein